MLRKNIRLTISHELQTQLTIFGQALTQTNKYESSSEYVQIIKNIFKKFFFSLSKSFELAF